MLTYTRKLAENENLVLANYDNGEKSHTVKKQIVIKHGICFEGGIEDRNSIQKDCVLD